MTVSDDKQQFKNRLSQNAVVQLAAKLLYMISRFGLPPIILSYVSLEEYGIWALCFVVISYLGMGTFGIANVYIRYTAEYQAHNDIDAINRLLTTGLAITIPICTTLLVLLGLGIPLLLDLFNVTPHLRETAAVLIFATTATMMIDLSFGAFSYVLNGLQRIARQTGIWVASFLLETVLIVGLLLTGLGIYALLWAFAIRTLLTIWLSIRACRQILPNLRLGPRYFDRHLLTLFYRFGGVAQISGLLSVIMYSVEKVIAGSFIGVRATGLFDLGEKLPVMSSQITASLNTVFLPAATHLHSLGQVEELRKLYLKGARYISLLTGLIMGFLIGFATPLMTAWLGPAQELQVTAFIMVWFTLPFHTHETTGPCTALHYGANRPARTLFYPLVQAILVVLLVGGTFLVLGVTIPAITYGVATAMTLSGWAYMAYSNYLLKIAQGAFIKQVILPGLVPYGFGLVLAWMTAPWFAAVGTERWSLLGLLALCGTIYTVVTLLFLYRVLCDWGEREYLRRQLTHTLRELISKIPRKKSP